MLTYSKQLQEVVAKYQKDNQPWPATTREIAAWAIKHSLWIMPEAAIIQRCAEDIAKALREEMMTDDKGRRVRIMHSATETRDGVQVTMWDDIRRASRRHMQMAFQQRRRQIVGDCKQLKTDVDSYNDAHNEMEPIQMVFDFREDLEEIFLAEEARG